MKRIFASCTFFPVALLAFRQTADVAVERYSGAASPDPAGLIASTNVFISGHGGYHTYRIPSLLVSASGMLLAFAEGRRTGSDDAGDIDLMLKRSTDAGKTWSPAAIRDRCAKKPDPGPQFGRKMLLAGA